MQTHENSISQVLGENGKGPLSPETIDKLRRIQAERLDSRWNARLEDLRRRAPFKELPPVEQDRAFLRLAQLSRSVSSRKSRKPIRRDAPSTSCSPTWNLVAQLNGGFDFGSADTPQVVPAHDYDVTDNIKGNTTVAATFPQTGQIGIGVAMGGWCDIVWEPTQTLFQMQGNRTSASLSKGFYVPNLAALAPGALTASCNLLLQSPFNFSLVAGDPYPDGPGSTLVWLCGQATIDVTACNIIDAIFGAPNPSKSASMAETLFIESGTAVQDNSFTNELGGNWDTTISDVDPSGIMQVYPLSATISQPLPSSDFVIVTISVEMSAWSLPAIQSVAFIDATGPNTGYPILTAPGYLPLDNTATASQPMQVTGLRLCGI